MPARTQTETAFGGLMLGMALPLGSFGAGLLADSTDLFGLRGEPLALPFGALILLGALLLGSAGATLLWWQRPARERALRPMKPRARRRELPVVKQAWVRPPVPADAVIALPPEPTPSLPTLTPESTTRLVAFAGTQRRVRVVARA